MLDVERLDVAYGRTQILFGVSVEVPAHGLVCVMGRNGVGKSTLLKAIMGVLPTRSGRIVYDGGAGRRELSGLAPHARVHAGLAYVPQGHEVFPHLSARENLLVAVEAAGSRAAGLDDVLDLFPALRTLLSRPAGCLSGGQQQQLAIARALATRPSLLLLDEPTEGIQPSIIREIEDAIVELHQAWGLSILLVEQFMEFALRLADRYVVLDAGRVAARGATGALQDESVRRLLAV